MRTFYAKFTAVLFLAVSLFTCLTGYAQEDKVIPKEAIVAEVNGEKITRDDLNKALDSMKQMIKMANQAQGEEMPEIPIGYLMDQALETIISFELIYQKAQELGITVTPEELDNEVNTIKEEMGSEEFKKNTNGLSEQDFRGSVLKSIYVRKVMEKVMPEDADKASDKEIQQYYEQMKPSLLRNYDMIRIAHIFFKLPENATDEEKQALRDKANNVKKLLNEGADWVKTTIKYSDALTDQAENGYFVPLPSFTKKIVKGELPPNEGEISEVLETEDGFVIVKLFEKKTKGGYLSFEEARDTIQKMLKSQKAAQYVEKYIRGLRSQANVKIYIKQHGR